MSNTSITMNIYIKEVAKRYGVSLSELAERLNVSRQTVYYYCEQGDKNPISQLEKIANEIGCDLEELFKEPGVDQNKPNMACPKCGAKLKLIEAEE